MTFFYKSVLYTIDTQKPNIVILPGNKVVFYGGEIESLPPQMLDGNIFRSLVRLLTFQGGVSFAKLANN